MVNPTSLSSNASKFASLPFDLCFVSETSATEQVQIPLQKQYKKEGVNILWGCPVPPQRMCLNRCVSIRGSSLGVAVMARCVGSSQVTLRCAREPLPGHWTDTCRVMLAYAHIPGMVVRCISVYGVQSTAPGARSKNLTLWYFLLGILQSSDIPTLVGGDFNVRPQNMEPWSQIASLGYGEAFSDHEALYGELLPPTCNSATRHDTLVYSRHFRDAFRGARVCEERLFPSHDPLIATFDLSPHSFVHRALPMPEPLCDTILNSDIFQVVQKKNVDTIIGAGSVECESLEPDCRLECLSKKLSSIGRCFEQSYDETVEQYNLLVHPDHQVKGRRRKAWDRLVPRKIRVLPPRHTPRKARDGGYEPPGEAFHVRSLQWVKQCRRLQAFTIRARKYEDSQCSPTCDSQCDVEWSVITNAKGFHRGFSRWVLDNDLVEIWYCEKPPVSWLNDLYDAFKVKVDELVRLEMKTRRNQFRHSIDVDMLHFGGSLCNALIKPEKPCSPSTFELVKEFPAKRIRMHTKTKPCLKVENACELEPCIPVTVDDKNTAILDILPDDVVLFDAIPASGKSFTVRQSHFTSNPDVAAQEFFNYWAPFWLRDSEASLASLHEWSEFLELCKCLPDLQIPDLDHKHTLDEWVTAVRDTKTTTARGMCGFSQPELLSCHPSIHQAFIDVFHSVRSTGLPSWLMVARTVLVPKHSNAKLIREMRPITILPLVVRTWCKITARRLLLQWSKVIPQNVVGSMPGRSCTQLTLSTAAKVESALLIGSDLGGFSLDISKCFNCFGRLPVSHLMKMFGLGPNHCSFWIQSINRMKRCVHILNTTSDPVRATTGLAEGDPLSVCGMVAVGFAWHCVVSSVGADTTIYVDDWAWISSDPSVHIEVMLLTQRFLRSLKLKSDPAKCWAWGTSKTARKWWSLVSTHVVGSPDAFRLCFAERELGAYLHFSRQMHLGTARDRIDSGLVRLKKLANLPIKSQKKALLIQTNVWPTMFFGSDTVYVGKKLFGKIRSAACEALVTKTQATSPLVAIATSAHALQDPLCFVILRALKIWRRLLLCDHSNRHLFWHLLENAVADPNRAFGPAVALVTYLSLIGWSFQSEGMIKDHLGVQFSLWKISIDFLGLRLHCAWDRVVANHVSARHDFCNWPEPFLDLTRSISSFDDARKNEIIASHQSFGPVFGSQKAQWSCVEEPAAQCKCPMCGKAEDSRFHFPLECSALGEIRLKHNNTISRIKESFPHLIFWPVVYKHPKHEMLQLIHQSRELPPMFEWQGHEGNGAETPTFFTDGSCAFPRYEGCRLAAFSIVQDLLTSDSSRSECGFLLRDSGKLPDSLEVVQVAATPGSQTINRSELCAIIQVVRSCPAARVFTDSAWSIDFFHAVRDDPVVHHHFHRCNFDLVCALCELSTTRDLFAFELVKIKSHLTDCEVDSNLDLYYTFGNRCADSMAKAGIQPHRSPVHELQWQVSRWYVSQQQLLVGFFDFLIEADICRREAFDRLQETPKPTHLVLVEDLLEWSPTCTYQMDLPLLSQELLQAFIPGASVLKSIVSWALRLRWPKEESIGPGISLFELAVNYLGVTGSPMPKVLRYVNKYPEYCDPLQSVEADLLPQTPWDVVRVLEHATTFLLKFAGCELFPRDHHQRKTYLRGYGYMTLMRGYNIRPVLPFSAL